MKISIAMATYNGAQYLKAQLQSFLDQTRQPDELIVTDDCSTDDTETIVREFAKMAHFKVEFHRNEQNLGYCGNFNSALMRATGDLVFLSDQDDVWFPKKIEHMIDVAERHPEALVVMNDAALTDEALNEVGLTKIGQIRSAGFKLDSFVMGCCCAIRRELLDLCMPIPSGFTGHDNWLVWFANGLDAKVIDGTILQYYRRHESNESQFIANRITKVTKIQAFIATVRNVVRKDSVAREFKLLEQLKIFVNGLNRISRKAPEQYKKVLIELESQTCLQIDTTESRMKIREKSLLPRLFAVGRLYMRGGYRNTTGIKAVLRDLIIRSA
jgi:glycosyltransferase involved in cell wall biosynthesis